MIERCGVDPIETVRRRPWRRLCLALLIGLFLACIGPLAAQKASAGPRGGFIVVDAASGEVLRARRSRVKLHPASLTKMMTLYLAFEAIDDGRLSLDQRLYASRHAASMPAMEVGVRRGQSMTVREAIRAAAVHSANDAAVMLAEAVSGTESAFAVLMTKRARAMGMKNTRFRNATGFTRTGHLSTARDMAKLARRLWIDFPKHYAVFAKKRVKARGRTLRATNGLLGAPGVDGIKTGFTRAAGYNLAASAERDGRRVMVVLMGGRTKNKRNAAVSKLLDDGFERLEGRPRRPKPKPQRRPRSDGEEVAMTHAPVPTPRPARGEQAGKTRMAPAIRSSARPSAADARWAVQLGAFFKRGQARDLMKRVIDDKSPGLVKGYRSIVTARVANSRGKPVTVHRVRFTGLAEADARAACDAMKKRRQACALVPPSGWGR